MVKTLSLVEYEVELEEKRSELLKVTKSIVDGWRVRDSMDFFYIGGIGKEKSPTIVVDLARNSVHVDSKDYLDEAMNLAEAYEKVCGENSFTLETDW